MHSLRRLALPPVNGWPRLLISLALLFVQATVAFTPISEARQGLGAAAHVEDANKAVHYAHNDANCAYCVARNIHAPAPTPPEFSDRPQESDALVPAVGFVAPARLTSTASLSRAPPSLL